jgi:hypothetical protein
MSYFLANAAARSADREATAVTRQSSRRARSSTKVDAIPPVARIPHRIGSTMDVSTSQLRAIVNTRVSGTISAKRAIFAFNGHRV